jgi:hypothetical protein
LLWQVASGGVDYSNFYSDEAKSLLDEKADSGVNSGDTGGPTVAPVAAPEPAPAPAMTLVAATAVSVDEVVTVLAIADCEVAVKSAGMKFNAAVRVWAHPLAASRSLAALERLCRACADVYVPPTAAEEAVRHKRCGRVDRRCQSQG